MKEKNMKILKYATLIGLIAYGQSSFAMEQIENAEAIQKMSLRDLAKYRAKMNELAEGMPNARQKAKFRDAYTEQINLAAAAKGASPKVELAASNIGNALQDTIAAVYKLGITPLQNKNVSKDGVQYESESGPKSDRQREIFEMIIPSIAFNEENPASLNVNAALNKMGSEANIMKKLAYAYFILAATETAKTTSNAVQMLRDAGLNMIPADSNANAILDIYARV